MQKLIQALKPVSYSTISTSFNAKDSSDLIKYVHNQLLGLLLVSGMYITLVRGFDRSYSSIWIMDSVIKSVEVEVLESEFLETYA